MKVIEVKTLVDDCCRQGDTIHHHLVTMDIDMGFGPKIKTNVSMSELLATSFRVGWTDTYVRLDNVPWEKLHHDDVEAYGVIDQNWGWRYVPGKADGVLDGVVTYTLWPRLVFVLTDTLPQPPHTQ